MKKNVIIFLSIPVLLLSSTSSAFAHVTVKPAEVNVGQRLNFTVSVPTEEEVPTAAIRVVIPEGLQSIRPNVKPGWKIELKKTGQGEEAKISEIIWTGGTIPAEQRDEFVFSAQAPTKTTELNWKAYQTYADGKIVSWDADPKVVKEYEEKNPKEGEDDHAAPKPYSITKVLDDLSSSPKPTSTQEQTKDTKNSIWISYAALALAAISLALTLRNRNHS